MNKLILVGKLSKVIDMSNYDGSYATTSFKKICLIIKDSYGKHTTLLGCVFNKVSEYVTTFCKEGDMLSCVGMISSKQYTNKQGEQKYLTNIIINEVQNLTTHTEEDLRSKYNLHQEEEAPKTKINMEEAPDWMQEEEATDPKQILLKGDNE